MTLSSFLYLLKNLHKYLACTGQYGEYLKINSPFKFSLYLAANRPVVVWSKSALASYVKEYKLGICVDS